MSNQLNVTFQDALDIIESFPEPQQKKLINIIRHRLIEHGRDLLSNGIKEAKEEYAKGEVKKGTGDDLMKDLSE